MTSIVDKDNVYTNFKHFVVDTRSFQIEKARNVEMYDKLRVYIQKQNEKRQQEMEMSAELKRAKREKELKHKQDKLTLDEIREEIIQQEKHLEDLKNQKDRLFADFKKVLTEDEARKNMQRAREAAFNNITFSTPNSADLPKPYQSAIVTVGNTSLVPSVVSSTVSSAPPPTLSMNGQQLYYPSHLQQLSTSTKSQQQQAQQQQTLTASPNASLQIRRDPTPQSHMSTPPNSKSMLLSQPTHLQQQQQQAQHQTQPLILSKPPQPTHHPSMGLHPGFPGIISHPQQSPQSFVNQNMSDRGRVSITGKRSHEQSNSSIPQPQAPPPQPQILSGPNSFLPRGAPPPMIPPGALHGHHNVHQALEHYHHLISQSISQMPNNPLTFLTNPNLPK